MYKNAFERAFSDIAPKTADEEFARKILNAADRQKPRTARRKAVLIPVIAAIVAVGTITASAAGGLDLFGAFGNYFSQKNEHREAAQNADLGAAGMATYDEIIDAGDYTVQINGLIADSHYAYLSFDVTYRDKKYFDGGKVAEKYREGSPVVFFEDRSGGSSSIHTTGWAELVAENGATVSYVELFAGEFTPDPQTGEYPFALTASCVDNPIGECTVLGLFPVNLSVPPAQERTVTINGEFPVSYKRTTVLNEASFGPLSMTLRFDNDFFRSDWSGNDDRLALKMKDGTEIDLSRQNSRLTLEDPTSEYSHQDFMNRETAAAIRAARAEKEPAETTLPPSETPTDSNVACVLELGYGTAINPMEIAEIKIFGETFSVE